MISGLLSSFAFARGTPFSQSLVLSRSFPASSLVFICLLSWVLAGGVQILAICRRRLVEQKWIVRSAGGQSSKHVAARKKSPAVHFSGTEVRPFRFDRGLADAVFYSREELAGLDRSRFADAAALRRTRNPNWGKGGESSGDAGAPGEQDIAAQLAAALDDPDADEGVSIRGIEHFVYPDLQREMIRRKKEARREVLEHSRAKKPDPHGRRLAELAQSLSQWARDVALEKAAKYRENNAAADPETAVSGESSDELEASQRSLRGSQNFPHDDAASSASLNKSAGISEDGEVRAGKEQGTSDDAAVGAGKLDELNEGHETQAAGADTPGED